MSRIFMLTSILLFLAGCQGMAEMEPVNIMLTDSPEPTPVQTPVLTLEPWRAAYCNILLHPENYEEFYAVAEHIPSEHSDRLNNIEEEGLPYCFSLSDLDRDGAPELLLGLGIKYHAPHVLLNILRYNEETNLAEDMDGPRTYPLMDTLGFSDTGYFTTVNGIGGLYTEFWHLEDDDPDHYWYGWERSAEFNEDGELVSRMEYPFMSSDGEKKFTLQEYYDLLGDSEGPVVLWREATEENIHQAFLPTAGEEEP